MSTDAICSHDVQRWSCVICMAVELDAARQRIAELEADLEIHRGLNKQRHEVIDKLCLAESRIAELEAERDGWATAGGRIEGMLSKTECALQATRGALEALLALAKKPMKSWEAGECVDAWRVRDIAEEALAALDSGTPTLTIEQVKGGPPSPDGKFYPGQLVTAAATPAAPMCASWCGSGVTYERTWAGFCSPACRDAGRPLHPTTPTPTEPR
jgi:hypothetical protein